MKKPTTLFFLILILAFLASILIFWRLFIYQPPISFTPIPTPTPAIPTFITQPIPITGESKGESPKDISRSLKQRFPLIEFLPHKTERFSIDYIAPFYLQVKIKNTKQVEEIKLEVINWIREKGINPKTHQIDWVTPAP